MERHIREETMAIVASKCLMTDREWTRRRVDFPAFSAALAKRRAELAEPDLPRNTGQRRTASKRALLKAIEQAGGKW